MDRNFHLYNGPLQCNYRQMDDAFERRYNISCCTHACVQRKCFQWGSDGRSLCVQISRERSYSLPYWYHSKGNWLRYNFAADSFYIMKLCSRLFQSFRPLLSKLSKRQIFVIYPHFEEVRGGVEPWLMARWKARFEFLLSVIELLFLSLIVEALQGKTCQNSLLSEGVGHAVWAKISGGRGRPWGIFFSF